MPKKFLEAGKIVGTHGVRGDLKVQPLPLLCKSRLCKFRRAL